MPHTNETTNYHLSQFIGTDIPNPLTDYNGDMEAIDTAIKAVADSAVSEGARVTALETQNGDAVLTTTAQTLSGAINELDSDLGGVDARLVTAEGKIASDEATLGTAVDNISILAGKVSGLETKVGSAVLTTTASDCSGAINELDGEVGNLASLETTVKTDVVSAINEVNTAVENNGKWELVLGNASTTGTNVPTSNPLNKYKELVLFFTNASNIISATTITTYDLFKLGGVEVDIYINDRNYVTVRYVDDTHVDITANISQTGLVCVMRGII